MAGPDRIADPPCLRGKWALLLAALDSVERRRADWRAEFSEALASALAATARRLCRASQPDGHSAATPEPKPARRRWFLRAGCGVLAGGVLLILLLPWWLPRILSTVHPGIMFMLGGPGRTVALTIDDAPTPSTPAILAVLRKHDVKATFFVVTDKIGDGQALAEIVADGHEIAHHMKTAKPCVDMTLEDFRRDFDLASERLREWDHVPFFRPAWGLIRDDQLAHARAAGYTVVLGTVFPLDNHLTDSLAISRFARWLTVPGGIIILHDGGGVSRRTANALDDLVPKLRRDGYRFRALSRH